MKQGSNRRPRPRSNTNKPRSGGRNSYDSTGPAGRVRGTAQQVLEKYQGLGQDALLSGDRIGAESFFQFAEHYYRIVNADAENVAAAHNSQQNNQQNNQHNNQQNNQRNADQNAGKDRSGQENTNQPEVVVNVPVVEADAPITTPEPETVVEVAATETVADVNEMPVVAEDAAPKTPRRRRSRAKAETPAAVEADTAEA